MRKKGQKYDELFFKTHLQNEGQLDIRLYFGNCTRWSVIIIRENLFPFGRGVEWINCIVIIIMEWRTKLYAKCNVIITEQIWWLSVCAYAV